MHRSTWCNPWQSLACCFPLQKFFTSFFVHHPSRIKNPRNQKHPQFHPVIHGNTRLRHPILFPFRPRTHEVEPIEYWLGTLQPSTMFLEIGPQFPRHRAGKRGSVSSNTTLWKSEPKLSRAWGESSLRPFAYKLESLPTRPSLGGQHGHTSSFAT